MATSLIVLGVFVLGLFLAARWLERAMLYHPIAAIEADPATAGHMLGTEAFRDARFEDVSFATADGETLRGWWIPASESGGGASSPRPVLLFFHGNAGNRSHRLHNLAGLNAVGISVFIFDYRGFGGSSGSPDEAGLLLDGEAAHDWLRGKVGARPIVYFGRSLGAALAARVALTRPPAGLILESPFTNVPEMAARVLPLPGVGRIVRSRFDALDAVSRLNLPLLIIHGEADELIPFHMGRALFEAAVTPRKTFRAVPEGMHNDTYYRAGEAYYPWITEFLEQVGRTTGD